MKYIEKQQERLKEILVQRLKEKENQCNKINGSNAPGTCKPKWDTITCWPETEPGQYRILPCAEYFLGFDSMKNATKFCYENGTWHHWSNYTQCYKNVLIARVTENLVEGPEDSLYASYLPFLDDISKGGYSISMMSLIFAFSILASVRKLWCPRNILHMHLFFSFIMRAFVSLLKDCLFALDVGLESNLVKDRGVYFFNQKETLWDCKLVVSILQYFYLSNYSWILMEAIYLHNLVFNALFSDRSSVTMYIIFGWGLPFLFLIPWIVCRILVDDYNCWTENENNYISAIIFVPVGFSNVVCFILFIRLVRVIFTKLQSSLCEQTQIYRRLAKSTLTLIPLFGVHYIIFLAFYGGLKLPIEATFPVLIIWRLFDTFQGFLVALLYCFLNSEVRTELNKTHFEWPRRRRNTDASDGKVFL